MQNLDSSERKTAVRDNGIKVIFKCGVVIEMEYAR